MGIFFQIKFVDTSERRRGRKRDSENVHRGKSDFKLIKELRGRKELEEESGVSDIWAGKENLVNQS